MPTPIDPDSYGGRAVLQTLITLHSDPLRFSSFVAGIGMTERHPAIADRLHEAMKDGDGIFTAALNNLLDEIAQNIQNSDVNHMLGDIDALS